MKMPSGQFCGIKLQSRLVSDFTFIESIYEPRQRHAKHSHERATLCFVLQGAFTQTYGPHTLECAPSTLLFYPAGEAHADSFHDLKTRCFVIELKPSWLEGLDVTSVLTDKGASFRGGRPSGLALRLYDEVCELDEFSHLSIEGLLLEMVAEISRSARPNHDSPPTRIALVKELVDSHLQEPLTLAELAAQAGTHPVYLAQAFRKACGCTIGEYVRERRIEFACRELINMDNTISEIAAAAGFFDQSHFTRTFKRVLGVTPGLFRKQLGSH